MTYKEVERLANTYLKETDDILRLDIIRKVWINERQEGLELLSKMLGIKYFDLYKVGKIKALKKEHLKKRRGRNFKKKTD
ncbi:MAG: hypothetical protein ACOY46_20645 [Bacillota bacterium]